MVHKAGMRGSTMIALALALIACGETGTPPAPQPSNPNEPSPAAVSDLRDAMKLVAGDAIFTLAIPSGARAIDVEAAVKEQCTARDFCQVFGWQDAGQVPGAWPMLDREAAALSFRYAINRASGYEAADWQCGSLGAKPGCESAPTN